MYTETGRALTYPSSQGPWFPVLPCGPRGESWGKTQVLVLQHGEGTPVAASGFLAEPGSWQHLKCPLKELETRPRAWPSHIASRRQGHAQPPGHCTGWARRGMGPPSGPQGPQPRVPGVRLGLGKGPVQPGLPGSGPTFQVQGFTLAPLGALLGSVGSFPQGWCSWLSCAPCPRDWFSPARLSHYPTLPCIVNPGSSTLPLATGPIC